jgi:hypothetical protein
MELWRSSSSPAICVLPKQDGTAARDGDENEEHAAEVQIDSLGASNFDLDAKAIGLEKKYVLDSDECNCILLNE